MFIFYPNKIRFLGSKYPKTSVFNFEHERTATDLARIFLSSVFTSVQLNVLAVKQFYEIGLQEPRVVSGRHAIHTATSSYLNPTEVRVLRMLYLFGIGKD